MIITLSEEEIRTLIVNSLENHGARNENIEFELDPDAPRNYRPTPRNRPNPNLIPHPIVAKVNLNSDVQPIVGSSSSTIRLSDADLKLASNLELDQMARDFGTDKSSAGHFYTKYYEQILKEKRNQINSVLEIGIAGGGSLKMWAAYFPNATIYGIDTGLKVSNSERIKVFQINQSDQAKLTETFSGISFDLIVDDGGHSGSAIIQSIDTLFNFLVSDGYYVIEDMTFKTFDSQVRTSLKEYAETFQTWTDSFSRSLFSWAIANQEKVKSMQIFPDKRAAEKMSGQTLIVIQKV